MPPATGEIYQVTYQGSIAGVTCENVLHYCQLTPLVTEASIFLAAERFWFFAQQIQSSDYLYQTMVIKRMTPIALDEHRIVQTTVAHGAIGSAGVNNTVAQIATIRTGTAGKSHRGRIYIGGVPAADTSSDGNFIAGGGAVRAAAFAAAMVGEFGTSGTNTALRLGIYSRVIGGIHPFTLAGWQQMTSMDMQTVLGNQRRRRVGVGI